ncbi:MAG: hypothetical protein WCK08_11595 [Betaproteobacteria bacterium]
MSDQPSIIRHESEHSVSFPEGSQVATSKPSDPQGPQVRKVLAGEDADSADHPAQGEAGLPPPFVKESTDQPAPAVFERTVPGSAAEAPPLPGDVRSEPATAAPVFERSIQDSSAQVDLPPELAPLGEQFETPVDRFLRERRQALPPQASEAPPEADAPVFERSLQDHREQLPEDVPAPLAPAQGPAFERSIHDHREAVPIDAPAQAVAAEGPVFERSLQDHKVALPEARSASREEIAVPPPIARRDAPELAPVPLAQAQRIISETASKTQAQVEQAIGAAGGQWAEMDFPARVVKLKIENDKVRDKLDKLEDLADEAKR